MKEKVEKEEEGYNPDTGRGMKSGRPLRYFPGGFRSGVSGFFRATGGNARPPLAFSSTSHREPQLVPRHERPAVGEIVLVGHETFFEHLEREHGDKTPPQRRPQRPLPGSRARPALSNPGLLAREPGITLPLKTFFIGFSIHEDTCSSGQMRRK